MSEQPLPNFGGSIPENYERYMVPLLFADYAADLTSRLDVPPGGAVLETACGTGAVTRHLRERLPGEVRLTITDLAPAMVERARQVVGERAGIEYRQADATELPFADGAFDAVICQFGVMFFSDKAKGMREAARVLKPGGRFAFNVWDRLERNVLRQAVHEAVADSFRTIRRAFSRSRTPGTTSRGSCVTCRQPASARSTSPSSRARATRRRRVMSRWRSSPDRRWQPDHGARLARPRGGRDGGRCEPLEAVRIGPDQRADAGVSDLGAVAGLTWRWPEAVAIAGNETAVARARS